MFIPHTVRPRVSVARGHSRAPATPRGLLGAACRRGGARYAVSLARGASGWRVERAAGLTPGDRTALRRALEGPPSAARDDGLPALPDRLGEWRLFRAPAAIGHALLIGLPPGGLDADAEVLLEAVAAALAASLPGPDGLPARRIPAAAPDLDGVLAAFRAQFPGEAADLAVRWGDRFRVAAASGFPEGWVGSERELRAAPLDARLVRSRRPVRQRARLLSAGWPLPRHAPWQTWLGLPLVIGERVIGRIGLAARSPEAFARDEVALACRLATELAPAVEGVLLFQEATGRLARLAVVHEISQIGGASGDEARVIERCLRVLQRAFNTPRVWFLRPQGARRVEALTAGAGPPAAPAAAAALFRQCSSGRTLRRACEGGGRAACLAPDSLTQLAAVVRFERRQLGALAVESTRPQAFLEDDERLLALVAAQMASLLDNARLYREMEAAVRRLTAVHDTALDLASRLDHPRVLDSLAERAQALVGVPAVELGLVDAGAGVVTIEVSRTPWGDFRGTRIALGQGLEGRVAASGRARAGSAALWWQARPARRHEAAGAAACVPLRWGDDTVGVLSVVDDAPGRRFTDDDLRLLDLLAPQAALTIRSARLVQDLRSQVEERKRTEARLIQSAKLAAVGQLAAGLAHEVNNPLTTVAGFAELWLEEMPADDPRRPEVELLTREAQRARAVVARLLDFAHKGEATRERSDLNEVVRESIDLTRHLLRLRGVTLHEQPAPDLPWIEVDRRGIKQVLLNLLHNAMQSMPEGGEVWVSTGAAALEGRRGVWVRVRDRGVGIAPENLGRMFEPFFTTKREGEGTGLGLAVSYGIVTDHGGRIDVKSEVGRGSAFEVWLPCPAEVEG